MALSKIAWRSYISLSAACLERSLLKFFKKAIGSSGFPQKVNIDKSGSNTAALKRINTLLFMHGFWYLLIDVRRIKYLNNMVEQDHRGIKNITKYTLGFKSFEAAEATISGFGSHIEWYWMYVIPGD